ncbi:MAG TPA: hypothetical protein VLM89_17510 [Phycisphaerae bacterium]|nr:hypothetical protein [Phycisphaerae bacterium]
MKQSTLFLGLVFVLGGVQHARPATGTALGTATAPAETASGQSPGLAEVRRVVGQLGHPSPTRRKAAMRQLAAWGPLACDALREAAGADDLETALSARDLLAQIESAFFLGAEIRLEVGRPRIAWDEATTLAFRVRNPTTAPIRVPWPKQTTAATRPSSDDAEQVGRMLDVADYLTVAGPDDHEIEPRLDPIDADEKVAQVVASRANSQPPFSAVAPGQESTLEVCQFNRGWARYPLLQAGVYHITFEHQPTWKDAAWMAEGLGRVRAGPVTIEVVRAAPDKIRLASRPLELRLDRRGEVFEAKAVSTWDRSVWLNLNLGPDLERFAQVRWRFEPGDGQEEHFWEPEPPSAAAGFLVKRLHRVDPCSSCAVASITVADAQYRAFPASAPTTRPCGMTLRYTNVMTAPQLRKIWAGRIREADIPAAVFTGSLTAEPVILKPPETGRSK